MRNRPRRNCRRSVLYERYDESFSASDSADSSSSPPRPQARRSETISLSPRPTPVLTDVHLDTVRLSYLKPLFAALLSNPPGNVTRHDIYARALAMEASVKRQFGIERHGMNTGMSTGSSTLGSTTSTATKMYREQMCMLARTLRDDNSPALRDCIVVGELHDRDVDAIAAMSNDDLEQVERVCIERREEAQVRSAIEVEVRNDDHDHDDETQSTTTAFECGNCRHAETHMRHLRDKNPIASVAVLLRCTNCDAHWQLL